MMETIKNYLIILLLIVVFGQDELVAQCPDASGGVFTRLYGNSVDNGMSDIRLINGAYYALGSYGGSPGVATFSKINLQGQIQWTVKLTQATSFSDYVETSDNAFLLVGLTVPFQSGLDNESILCKIDDSGNLLWTRYYNIDLRERFGHIVRVDNPPMPTTYYVSGIHNSGGTSDNSILINFSENGVINNVYRYPAGDTELHKGMELLSNGDIALMGNVSGTFGFLGTVDLSGNFTNAWNINAGYYINDGIEIPGSNDFVVVGQDVNANQGFIARFDNMGQEIWAEKILGEERLTKINLASDGSYYVLGTGSLGGVSRGFINHFVENSTSVTLDYVRYFDQGETAYAGSSLNITNTDDLLFGQYVTGNPSGFGGSDAFFGVLDTDISVDCRQDTMFEVVPFDLTVFANTTLVAQPANQFDPNIVDLFESEDYECAEPCIVSEPCDATVPDTCCNAMVDVIFLLDNSGSVQQSEFDDMVALAQNTMMEIDSAYCEALFAVTHYAGHCGNEIHIEHDFSSASIAQGINRPGSFSSGGDDLNEALGTLKVAIDGNSSGDPLIVSSTSSLNGRLGATTLLVIFTDAWSMYTPSTGCISGGSAMRPYTNSNILKAPPYNTNITLVHLEPTNTNVQSVGAAIASNGGVYTGIVDANIDPVSNALPRQFIPANFGVSSIDILNSTPPCDSIVPFVCCDDLIVTTNVDPSPNACCYDLDLTNNVDPSITCFEVEMLSTDWQFNTGSLVVGSGFGWQSTPTNNKLIIEHSSGAIPAGLSPNALEYCMAPATASPSTLVTLVYRWYQILPDGSKREVCTETIETQCDPPFPDPCLSMDSISVACNPDNPYEYFVNFTVTNNSSFDADKIVLEDLAPGFAFSFCGVSSPTNIIAIPTSPNPLPSGATSNTMCVKVISPNPIWSPTDVCFDLGLFGEFDCCHSNDSVCITLDNCCNPCDERDLVIDDLQTDSSDCCYSIDIVDSCGYTFFTKIETEIITPGVIFGYHALGGPDAADWFVLANSTQTSITWWNHNSYVPYGTTEDIMQFCLSGITDPSQVPQEVVVKWYAQNAAGEDYVACTDTLEFECAVEEPDYSCLNISDREIECVEDSSKYQYTFTVTNTSTIPFSADYLDVSILAPSSVYFDPSGGIFPLPQPFNPGDSHQITSCIKTTGTFPVTPQDLVLRYRLRYAMGDTCCYNAQLDTLFIPPCGPADCDSLIVSVDQSTSDSCCHTLDFNNLYTEPIYTIELEVLTAGVIFGNHSTGGPSPTNWHNPLSTATKIQWALLSGNQLPYGTSDYDDLINFCLDGIDPGETPQDVVVRWLDGDSMVVCTDTLTFDCIDDFGCVDLTDTQLSCDENGDYNFTFTVVNNSNPAHVADLLMMRPVPPTSPIQFTNGSFPLSPTLNFGDSFTGTTTITGAMPGDTLKFEMRLEDTTSGDSWCCFESDTFCIVIPPCCCTDSTSFYDLVDMGFDTLIVCDTLSVKGLALDSCHQVTWTWGDGTANTGPISGDSTVTHDFGWPGVYNVCMEVENIDADGNLCWEETYCEDITVESCCKLNTIVINNGLTPNGDGFNDEFKIVGAEQCRGVSITIYNRWGNVVYKQDDYEEGPNWGGISKKEEALPQGTYYYIIDFKDLGEQKAGYLDVRY